MTEKLDLGEQSITLEKFTFVAEQYITKKLAREFAIRPRVHVSESPTLDALVLAVRQDVYGRKLGVLEIRTPATWWQMFKEAYAPEWIKRRWPVRYNVRRYDTCALYPHLAIGEEDPVYAFVPLLGGQQIGEDTDDGQA